MITGLCHHSYKYTRTKKKKKNNFRLWLAYVKLQTIPTHVNIYKKVVLTSFSGKNIVDSSLLFFFRFLLRTLKFTWRTFEKVHSFGLYNDFYFRHFSPSTRVMYTFFTPSPFIRLNFRSLAIFGDCASKFCPTHSILV